MQGTRVQSLLWEDPTPPGATNLRVPQLLSQRSRAQEPRLLYPATTAVAAPRARAPQKEKHRNENPVRATGEQPLLAAARWKPPSNGDPAQPKQINKNLKIKILNNT